MKHKYFGLKLIAVAVIFAVLHMAPLSFAASPDLQLKIDTDLALNEALSKQMLLLNNILLEQDVGKDVGLTMSSGAIMAEVRNNKRLAAFQYLLKNDFKDIEVIKQGDDPHFFGLKFTDAGAAALKETVLQQTRATIANRLKLLDIAAEMETLPPDGLTIKLKDAVDSDRVKNVVTQRALLEFKNVRQTIDAGRTVSLDLGPDVAFLYTHPAFAGVNTDQAYIVDRNSALTGGHIIKAESVYDKNYNMYLIAIEFDAKGAELFAEITKANIGKPLAIVLDGAVVSAPIVHEQITGGKAIISGNFTKQETRDLAALLQAGSLQTPVSIVK